MKLLQQQWEEISIT